MSTAAIAFVALLSVTSAMAASNCAGAGFDLSSLAGSDIAGADASYKYILQLCGTTTESVCAGNGGSLCQYNTATPPVYSHVLAKWDASGVWSQCTDAVNCKQGGVQVVFNNGDKCGGSGPARQVTFQIACPASGNGGTSYTITSTGCIYNVVMVNSIGCGGGGGGGGGGNGGSKGISGGTIFLIVLVVVIPVYVAVGCIYKRQKMGTSGMESCPNIDFWRDFPSLVGDGFKFTWRKLTGLCGKGDTSYETMK